MIIDCHCHAGKGDGLTGPWDTAAPLEQHLRRAAQAGIDRTVIFALPLGLRGRQPRGRRGSLRARPQPLLRLRLRARGARPRPRDARWCRTPVEQLRLRGIKLHRYDARITREICEAARALRVPVLYDAIGEVSVVELLADRVPGRGVHHPAPAAASPTTGARSSP